MGVQAALDFIARVRADAALRDRVRELAGNDGDLDAVARLGAERGLDFTADELRAAFAQDWAMRRLRYEGGRAPVTGSRGSKPSQRCPNQR
ncbi:MAG TPA: Nif11-like leader peptide family natural product precursor [Thermoleophilaceae bacterium]|nr:Nif11-like leader peptide family natural product precursor [Thermoleophilaceae bacterium]